MVGYQKRISVRRSVVILISSGMSDIATCIPASVVFVDMRCLRSFLHATSSFEDALAYHLWTTGFLEWCAVFILFKAAKANYFLNRRSACRLQTCGSPQKPAVLLANQSNRRPLKSGLSVKRMRWHPAWYVHQRRRWPNVKNRMNVLAPQPCLARIFASATSRMRKSFAIGFTFVGPFHST